VRADDRTSESVSTVETHAVTTSGAVHLDLSGVRLKALGWVFSCDSALDCKAADGNAILSEAELLERGTSSDLNLSGDQVYSGYLFSDGVFNLTVRR